MIIGDSEIIGADAFSSAAAEHEEIDFNKVYESTQSTPVVYAMPISIRPKVGGRNNYTESAQDTEVFTW